MASISSEETLSRKEYIVFFDVDHTLTSKISGSSLVRSSVRKGLMTTSALAKAIYLSIVYKLNLRNPLKIMDDMIKWVKGIPEKTMNDLCTELVRDILLPSVYAEARDEIELHKKNNAKVVILSSALAPICNQIAKDLGFDDIICSSLEARDGFLTGLPAGRLCFGEEKKIRLLNYCANKNFNPYEAWYYGDSITDLGALCSVGNPVCVNPDRKLKKAAVKKGWPILHWHH